MTSRIKRFAIAAAAALGLLTASAAHGTLVVSATIGGVPVCSVDNNLFACTHGAVILDANATAGFLGLDPVQVGGVDLFGSLQIANKGLLNILTSSSLQIINTNPFAITANVAVSDTNFTPPVASATVSGSGTWVNAAGSAITYEWYNDPANTQGADNPFDRPGILLDTFFDAAGPDNPDAFSHSGGPFAISDPDPFSMTVAFDMTLAGLGRLEGRSMAEVKPQQVSEPNALALLAAGLVAFGLSRKRR